MKFKPLVLMSCLFACFMVAKAAQVTDTQVHNTMDTQSVVSNIHIDNSQIWEISQNDWQHYQRLMKGTAGKWYQNLTPAQVLTMYADNPQDQERYAEIVAKEQHDRVERELRYAMAVYHAGLKLYPNEPIMRNADISAFNPVKKSSKREKSLVTMETGDHLVLFVDTKAGLDFATLPVLLRILRLHPGVVLDIYCIGNVSNSDIQAWAQINSIPMDLVTRGRITLNHDNGKMKSMFISGKLPYVALIHNGVAHEVNLNNLS